MKTEERKQETKNGVMRLILALIAIVAEVVFIALIMFGISEHFPWIDILIRIFALILVLVIYGMHISGSLKSPWIILILLAPVLGTLLYFLIGTNLSTRKMKKNFTNIDEKLFPWIEQKQEPVKNLYDKDLRSFRVAQYLCEYSHYPVYQNTDVVYYDDAAKGLEAQLKDLAAAKHFIFMEYHAIEMKESFQRILDILTAKVKEGVDVRVFYDDMGSIGFINTDFVKKMEELGIQCRVFNPFAPGLNIFLNNRDHRKITVVDGLVGYTGGYNLANEYFNLTSPYGHWKDTGIRLEGDAVKSLTVTFLEMWNAASKGGVVDQVFDHFFPVTPYVAKENGFIQPYADNPLFDERVGENVYMSIVESAEKYAWFITPYLILTDEMIHSLGLAAKRGVDVRIITPGIPDKKLVYSVTRSYYNALVRNGVRIYEYTPGFCHCKMSVSDNRVATCGTINMDYRSLYLHFENGCYMSNCQAVLDIRDDFVSILPKCKEVTAEYLEGRKTTLRLWQLILRLFAPLM